jgi:hypothetical protein
VRAASDTSQSANRPIRYQRQSGRTPENRTLENRDIENRDIENRDIENRDIENRDIESQSGDTPDGLDPDTRPSPAAPQSNYQCARIPPAPIVPLPPMARRNIGFLRGTSVYEALFQDACSELTTPTCLFVCFLVACIFSSSLRPAAKQRHGCRTSTCPTTDCT